MAPPTPPPANAAARTRVRAAQRRRTTTVKLWRFVLPLLIVAIMGGVVGWIVQEARARKGRTEAPASAIHMTNPHYYGRDSKGRPFVLTGTDAVRDAREPNVIALSSPSLSLDIAPGRAFTATSQRGRYHEDTHRLEMAGDVVVQDGAGNTFRSQRGNVDTMSGDVDGQDDGRLDGASGWATGKAFRLSDNGDHATFTGGVKSHLVNGARTPPGLAVQGAAKP